MTKEELQTTIAQLESTAQQNIMNHQALLGRLAQCKDFLKALESGETVDMDPVESSAV